MGALIPWEQRHIRCYQENQLTPSLIKHCAQVLTVLLIGAGASCVDHLIKNFKWNASHCERDFLDLSREKNVVVIRARLKR